MMKIIIIIGLALIASVLVPIFLKAKDAGEVDVDTVKKTSGAAKLRLVIGAILVLSPSFWYINMPYERSLITRMGTYQTVTDSGLRFKMPFLEARHIVDTRMDEISLENIETPTAGGANVVYLDVTINHRINSTSDDDTLNLFEQFGKKFDYEGRLLKNLAADRLKAIVGQYPIEAIIEKRGEIRGRLFSDLNAEAQKYGITMVDVQIQGLDYGDKYKSRLSKVADARAKAAEDEQLSRAAVFEAERRVKEANAERDSTIAIAEGEAKARELTSISEAAAVQREGEAKAASLKAQANAIKASPELIELTRAEAQKNWDGSSMPETMIIGQGGSGPGVFPFLDVTKR